MKRFLITYTFRLGHDAVDTWHKSVGEFITALDNDPELKGRISYKCMRVKDNTTYYHLAEVLDESVVKLLQQRPFFKSYTEETNRVGGAGTVEVLPLDTIAETSTPLKLG